MLFTLLVQSVASHMFNLMKHGPTSKDSNADYYRQLEELTAARLAEQFERRIRRRRE